MNAPAPAPTSARRPELGLAAVLVCAGAAAYHGSFGGPFVYDDLRSIAENPTLRHLSWSVFWAPGRNLTVSGRPLVNASLAVSYALSGEAVWGYHLLNLLIHLAAGLTLFGLVRRTALRLVPAEATGFAFAVALLWVLHPLQTEAVLYMVQRAEALMALFYLLTLYGFARAVAGGDGRGSLPWLALSGLACLAGMATKEVMVSAPLAVLLYDRAFAAGTLAEAWRRRRGYYLGLAATWLPLAALVAAGGGDRGGTTAIGAVAWKYWLTQPIALARYLQLAFWPRGLVFDYGAFWVRGPAEVVPAALLLLALAAVAAFAVVRRPRLGFLGFVFFAVLAPTSLVPGTIQMIAEHRMYLALAPVLVLAVLALRAAAGAVFGSRGPWVAGAVGLALAAAAGLLTARRARVYRTEFSLWADTAAKRPNNAFAQNNLGRAFFLQGRPAEARAHYQRALELDPADPEAHYNLANLLSADGRLDEAQAEYEAALRLRPDFAEARNNLGLALFQAGRPLPAIAQFEAVLRLQPDSFQAHGNLADALAEVGRLEESAAEYGRALALRPDSAGVHENLGLVLARMDQADRAADEFAAAVRLDPRDPELRANLALTLRHLGRTAEADAQMAEAERLARRP